MKKVILIGVGVILVAILIVGTVIISGVGGAEIAEGTYSIVGFDTYPDASITVVENKVKFNNIDLNAIYAESQIADYKRAVEDGFDLNIADDQVPFLSDLNKHFVVNGYEIDYKKHAEYKNGTFSYIYYCYVNETIFGLTLEYNSLEKKIEVKNPVQRLVFKQ